MDFFSAQDHARKQTRKLVVYFILAVVGIIVAVYLVAAVLFSLYLPGLFSDGAQFAGDRYNLPGHYAPADPSTGEVAEAQVQWWNPKLLLATSAAVLAVVLGASAVKSLSLRSGGGVVARSLGGRQVDPGTRDRDERRLMNVVEEMALASGTPVPEVYILDEDGINAFAAGHTPDDAAVAVTRGCLHTLNRDELQGVIAHEFSHILNGDMRLNLRLIGILFGILVLAVIGQGMLRSAFLAGGSRRGSRGGGNNSNNAAIVILLLGGALMLIGYIGIIFGRLIQSAISRQREFLADASAVQFTRYPDGIANALIKIGAGGSRLQSEHTQETAHMFFANALKSNMGGGLATHPPLPDRIRAIKPDWNGEFAVSEAASAARKSPPLPPAQSARPTAAGGTALTPAQVLAAIGTLSVGHVVHAQGMFDEVKTILGEAGSDPAAAKALIYALMLCEESPEGRARHLGWLKGKVEAASFSQIDSFSQKLAAVGPQVRLPLLELVMPALAKLDKDQLQAFGAQLEALAKVDEQFTFGELAIVALVRRKVIRKSTAGAGGNERSIGDAAELAAAFSQLLSAVVAAADAPSTAATAPAAEATRKRVFEAALAQAPLFAGLVSPVQKVDNAALLPALEQLGHAAFSLKKQILAAAVVAVSDDGKISAQEGEWLRLIAACLDCPLPPLAAAAPAPS